MSEEKIDAVDIAMPELIFGLVGPIGVNLNSVQDALIQSLKNVGYDCHTIHITKILAEFLGDNDILGGNKYETELHKKIELANKFRETYRRNDALAALSISHIRNYRKNKKSDVENEIELPVSKTAYIIRQFKNSEEVLLMRKVYGKKFIQISIQSEIDDRIKFLEDRISSEITDANRNQCKSIAYDLFSLDANEKGNEYGQRLEKVFHLGDVFIDASDHEKIKKNVERFIDSFFGDNSVSPSKDEYGSYLAFSASYRSIDLSRQVGAAIFSREGEIVSLGSNEVPKFGGGTYWPDDKEKYRDFDIGAERNKIEKEKIYSDILRSLKLKLEIKNKGEKSTEASDIDIIDAIGKSLVSDITEYGRMVHAEMNAICDAAKQGRQVKGATIYVTTFPCHNCAKHIVASGIERVVFIEPYPKSRAVDSHYDSMTLKKEISNRVVLEHFLGISHRRFRDIFEKQSRVDRESGKINKWYEGRPMPRIENYSSDYFDKELDELGKIFKSDINY